MKLESLRVAQVLKASALASKLDAAAISVLSSRDTFFLDSCQRYLWVFSEDQTPLLPQDSSDLAYFEGIGAYRFLLRIATGLESQILGETDIFGQLKTAWKSVSQSLDPGLSFWLQKIFEDTKEIRSRHLENLGGASYGSLVRRYFQLDSRAEIVGKLPEKLRGTTLLVGAGSLGAGVAPYLLESDRLWIANRSFEKASALATELSASQVTAFELDDARVWAQADRVVLCIPTDTRHDAERAEWARGRKVLHLGCLRADAGVWAQLPGATFLDDLFLLQKSQGEARSIQLAAAARSCDERAKLRGLGTSVSIAHGWEDLAVFA